MALFLIFFKIYHLDTSCAVFAILDIKQTHKNTIFHCHMITDVRNTLVRRRTVVVVLAW